MNHKLGVAKISKNILKINLAKIFVLQRSRVLVTSEIN